MNYESFRSLYASFYLDFFLINKLVPSIKVMLFLLEESTSVEMITEVLVCVNLNDTYWSALICLSSALRKGFLTKL